MNFYIAEPVTRLPLFNFLVRYIFTEVLYNENTMLFRKEFGNNQQCRSDGEPFGAGSGRNSALEKRLGNRSESIVGQIEWDSGLLKGR